MGLLRFLFIHVLIVSSLDDRLTKLEAHYYSKFSQTLDTPETPNKTEPPLALIKSPPVPALKRKMDAAMEWEKSMMSGEMSLTSIEEAEANEEEEEIRQNGMQNIKGKEPKQVYSWRKQTTNEAFVVIELGERVSDQQAQIDQMKQQMSQQSEQSRPYF